jgi:hypothetical protein
LSNPKEQKARVSRILRKIQFFARQSVFFMMAARFPAGRIFRGLLTFAPQNCNIIIEALV